MRVLGISCFFHDAAACLIEDGRVIAAVEEERFTRVKHDPRFPVRSINWCLEMGGVEGAAVDHVIFHEKPLLKFERILSSCVDGVPGSLRFFVDAMGAWLGEKIWVPGAIRKAVPGAGETLYSEHHLSHAASAFLTSPFDDAAIVTADAVGEWTTTTIGIGEGRNVRLLKELRFPHSLGLLYSAITAYLGFEVNEGEYKVMGLAAYGQPTYEAAIRQLIPFGADGSYRIDGRFFGYQHSSRVWRSALVELLGPPRRAGSEIDGRHADIAASLQKVTEDALVAVATEAHRLTGSRRLAFAGGVALNVLANRAILRRTPFEQLYVPPGPGDSGAAIGAAAYLAHTVLGEARSGFPSAYLGPEFGPRDIEAFLDGRRIPYERGLTEPQLLDRVADLIGAGRVVGWFDGRMEFGPRALGSRSILANPCAADMKELVNLKIKHREPFRPFGPAVTLDAMAELFADRDESPFMLLVTDVLPAARERIPAVVHVDGTVRYQTVTREDNPRFHQLIQRVGTRTGVPAVLNTSFNVAGEPIVCTPEDAFRCFSGTELDALVLGPYLIGPDAKRDLGPRTAEASAAGPWLA
jgi:carbamoyltransferase